jgi:hypothetical protein
VVTLADADTEPPEPLRSPAFYWVNLVDEQRTALAGRLDALGLSAKIRPVDGPGDLTTDVASSMMKDPVFLNAMLAVVVATVAGVIWASPWAIAAGLGATALIVWLFGRRVLARAAVDADWLLNATWGLDDEGARRKRMELSLGEEG